MRALPRALRQAAAGQRRRPGWACGSSGSRRITLSLCGAQAHVCTVLPPAPAALPSPLRLPAERDVIAVRVQILGTKGILGTMAGARLAIRSDFTGRLGRLVNRTGGSGTWGSGNAAGSNQRHSSAEKQGRSKGDHSWEGQHSWEGRTHVLEMLRGAGGRQGGSDTGGAREAASRAEAVGGGSTKRETGVLRTQETCAVAAALMRGRRAGRLGGCVQCW
mgnify:CR=1 FL=1